MIKLDWCEVAFTYDRDKGVTIAYVNDLSDDSTFVGLAICSHGDQFNKNTGRKVALTDALKRMELTREKRKEVWEAYFKARHGKY